MTETFVKELIERFDKSQASSLVFSDGSSRLALRRGGANASAAYTAAAPVRNAAPETEAPAAVAPHAAGNGDEAAEDGTFMITSPIVATFYLSAAPDSPPFVQKGSKVKKGGTLCILEAMKMMNHLEAERDCEILEIKVRSGDLVEFSQELFKARKI